MTSPEGFGRSDHLCWSYRTDDDRRDAVVTWLADGLRLGQQAFYVADRSPQELMADLAALPEVDELVASGSVAVFPTSQLYDLSRPIDPVEQLAIYDRAVRAAIDSGFDGIRVAADITSLVADPGRRSTHVHWEQVADRYIARQPLAPLCLFDATRIRSLDAVVCVHPLRHTGAADAEFGVWSGADGVIVLEGEIDGLTSPVLSDVLAGLPHGDRDAIDVSALRFLDGRSAFILHDALRSRRAAGHDVVLAGANEQLRRLWAMCGFDDTWFAAA